MLGADDSFPRLLAIHPSQGHVWRQKLKSKVGVKTYYDVVFLCESQFLGQLYPDAQEVKVDSAMDTTPCTARCLHDSGWKDTQPCDTAADKARLARLQRVVEAAEKPAAQPALHCTRVEELTDGSLTLDLTREKNCHRAHIQVQKQQSHTLLPLD